MIHGQDYDVQFVFPARGQQIKITAMDAHHFGVAIDPAPCETCGQPLSSARRNERVEEAQRNAGRLFGRMIADESTFYFLEGVREGMGVTR